MMETSPTSPYPLRPTETLSQEGWAKEVEPLVLTEDERRNLLVFEQELFSRLEPIQKLSPSIHTVFPAYFATEEGWRTFQDTYGETNPAILSTELPTDAQAVAELFFSLQGLHRIPRDQRKFSSAESSDWARDQFIQQLFDRNGNLGFLDNPYYVSRVVNTQTVMRKAEGLRTFKQELKGITTSLGTSNIDQARKLVVQLYGRYTNVLIAQLYSHAAVIARSPNLTPADQEVVFAVRGQRLFPDSARKTGSTRVLARMDRFLQGVGLETDEQGYFRPIPTSLERYIEERVSREPYQTTLAEEEYSNIRLSPAQMKIVANIVLHSYGLDAGGWRAEVDKSRISFSVSFKSAGESAKVVRVPGRTRRTLPRAFMVLAHEIEGHVLRYANRDLLQLKLLQELSTGRDEALSEASAVWVEEETHKQIFGEERPFAGTYYWTLKEKLSGGSFKECFWATLRATETEPAQELLRNKREFFEKARRAFRRTLRIFHNGRVPLDDRSGAIVDSGELAYHEPVAEGLAKLGLERVLFLPSLDVYSIEGLQRLGIIDWDKIKTPQFVVARKLWPVIKEGVKGSEDIDQILQRLAS